MESSLVYVHILYLYSFTVCHIYIYAVFCFFDFCFAFWLLAFVHVRRLVLGGFLSQGHIRSFSPLEECHSVIHFGLFVGFLKTSYRHPGHFNFSQACSVSCSVPFLHSRDFKHLSPPFLSFVHFSRDFIAFSISFLLSFVRCLCPGTT